MAVMKEFEVRFTDWQEKDYYTIKIEQKSIYKWQLTSNIWGEELIDVDYHSPDYSAKKIKDKLTETLFNFDLKGYNIHWADTAGFVLFHLIALSEERLTLEVVKNKFEKWSKVIVAYNKIIKQEAIY